MADFCKACSEELFGRDHGELAGLTSFADFDQGKAALVICEGCGPINVDPMGRCLSKDCLKAGMDGHGQGEKGDVAH